MLIKKIFQKIQRRVRRPFRDDPVMGSVLDSLDRHQIALAQREQARKPEEILDQLKTFKALPVFSIIMPVYNPPARVFRQTLDSVFNQAYPHWELCLADDASPDPHVRPIIEQYQKKDSRVKVSHLAQNKGISGASNQALSSATGDFICLVDHDDLILHDTLFEVAQRINEVPELDFVYTDSAIVDIQGNLVGFFYKPDFNWEMFLCHNWVGQLSTIRRSLVEKTGGWTEGREGQDFDLFLRCIEQARQVSHIEKILYYWRQAPASIAVSPENKPRTQGDQRAVLKDCLDRNNIEGSISDVDNFMFRIHRPLKKPHQISVIVCLTDLDLPFPNFLNNLMQQLRYPETEILLFADPFDVSSFAGNKIRFLEFDHEQTLPYNLNYAVEESEGEFCFFVFQSFTCLQDDWLTNLVEQAQRSEAGMVAGKLLNDQNQIETAGAILSQNGPLNIFKNADSKSIGDANCLISPRSCRLLSGNLAMISKSTFGSGFDARFQSMYFDYDLCMRLEEKGRLNLFTPFTVLQLDSPHNFDVSDNRQQKHADISFFKRKWGHRFGEDGHLNLALQNAILKGKS
ncbi:MAG: glycosyltransferase [SAR324 cluster bacterium]|nr:glycosyltransferase [SAR324 cluster bacterium]